MKALLPLCLVLPLQVFAQFGRSYTGPTMQQNMQSRQDFNRMTSQRTQDFQNWNMQRRQENLWRGGQPVSKEALAQAQAKQQQREQEATAKLAQLAQEQQRRRAQHPAKNPQQAAAQQKADDKQLNLLAVKNYQEVFLPGQLTNALLAQRPSPSAQQGLRTLSDNLQSDNWWRKQEAAQATAQVKAYGDSLTVFATGLLGFDLVAPPAPPAPFSARALSEQLAKDTFDQNAAGQLLQDASLAERLAASQQLTQAVKAFTALSASATTDPALQGDPKKLRKEVQKSLRTFEKELARYQARLASSDELSGAEAALRKSTTAYLAKNAKASR